MIEIGDVEVADFERAVFGNAVEDVAHVVAVGIDVDHGFVVHDVGLDQIFQQC